MLRIGCKSQDFYFSTDPHVPLLKNTSLCPLSKLSRFLVDWFGHFTWSCPGACFVLSLIGLEKECFYTSRGGQGSLPLYSGLPKHVQGQFSGAIKQPKEKVLGSDIPRTSRGHSRGRVSKNFGQARQSLCADIHHPNARTGGHKKKLRAEKHRPDFSFPKFEHKLKDSFTARICIWERSDLLHSPEKARPGISTKKKIPKKYPPARDSGLRENTPKIPKKYPRNTKKPVLEFFFGITGVFGRYFLGIFVEFPGRVISGLCSRSGRSQICMHGHAKLWPAFLPTLVCESSS